MKQYCVFRLDVNPDIGLGHAMRCMTLGKQFLKFGYSIAFICRYGSQNYRELIINSGFDVFFLSEEMDTISGDIESKDAEETLKICHYLDVSFMVVDHYQLGLEWEIQVRREMDKLIVIDDLANRKHDCYALLDSTLHRKAMDYKSLVNKSAHLLMGSKFSLLRDEFRALRSQARIKRRATKKVETILINFGGTDPKQLTLLAHKRIRAINEDIKIDIVLSSACLYINEILALSKHDHQTRVWVDSDSVSNLMLTADLAIGALGTTSWERCCLGLPAIALMSADNQRQNAQVLKQENAIILSSQEQLKADIECFIGATDNMKLWHEMAESCDRLCDGKGADRVVSQILSSQFSLAQMTIEDVNTLYSWQVQPTTRKYARHSEIPSYINHVNWLENSLKDHNRNMWVVMVNDIKTGYVRLDGLGDKQEVSILISEEFRGIGLAEFAIKEAINRRKHKQVLAYIETENIASIALFNRCGFQRVDDNHYLWSE